MEKISLFDDKKIETVLFNPNTVTIKFTDGTTITKEATGYGPIEFETGKVRIINILQGKTILTGAPVYCPDCGTYVGVITFKVLRSGARYYVGTVCNCGPYSRETGYGTKEQAEAWLQEIKQGNFVHTRGNIPSIEQLIKEG